MIRSIVFALALVACTDKEEPVDDTGLPPGQQDKDGDGSIASLDCNDDDAAIYPGAVEVCNGADDDCDQLADEEASDEGTFYADSDADGYGDPANVTVTCNQPTGSSLTGDDCDDTDASIHPGGTEICDALDADEDCNGASDDLDTGTDVTTGDTWYTDADADGYGDTTSAFSACDSADGRTATSGDCDDADAEISPDATEVCDADDIDEDCDGNADDADTDVDTSAASTWYLDSDGDGYGDPDNTTEACDLPALYSDNDDDCNDDTAAYSPGATEICDTDDTDEDCDGLSDNDDDSATGQTTWYADFDQDGYGDLASTADACDQPDSYTSDTTDCDDTNVARYPGAVEQCDGQSNDCDSATSWTDDSETGVVSWIDSFGGWTSETVNFGGGEYAWTAPGDGELVFCEGEYETTLATAGYDVTITGLYGSANTLLDADGAGSVIDISGGSVTVEGLGLTGGTAASGGGIHCLAATLSVLESWIYANTSTGYGGGVFLQSCTAASIADSVVEENLASSGGGIYATNSDGLTLDGVQVSANEASVLGGGVAASASDFTIVSTTIELNAAGGSYVGGGLWSSASTGSVSSSTIVANASGRGAAYYLAQSTLSLTDVTVSSNEASSYGAAGFVYDSSTLTTDTTTFTENVSGTTYGALHVESSAADFADSIFDYNVGTQGLLTFAGSALVTISGSEFTGNTPYDAYANSTGYTLTTGAIYTCTSAAGCY